MNMAEEIARGMGALLDLPGLRKLEEPADGIERVAPGDSPWFWT